MTAGTASAEAGSNRPARTGASRSSRRAAAPRAALTPTQLLEKIDALDWDDTVTPEPTIMVDGVLKPVVPTPHRNTLWIAIGAVLAMIALVTGLYFWMKPAEPPSRALAAHPIGAAPTPSPEVVEPPPTPIEPAPLPPPIEIAPDQTVTKVDETAAEAELRVQRRAERLRKQREAEAERIAEQERQREAQVAAQRRQVEEQAAAEAARAAQAKAQAAPKAPSSPQEVCAGESNSFTRSLCEVRACNRAEWRTHPQCVKRVDDQLRSMTPAN